MKKDEFKITLLGLPKTGKSIIAKLLAKVDGVKFSPYEATIGASFHSFHHNEAHAIIWDCAGNERYQSLLPMYLRSTNVILLFFDPSSSENIEHSKILFNKIKPFLKDCHFYLIANFSSMDTNSSKKVNDLKQHCKVDKTHFIQIPKTTEINQLIPIVNKLRENVIDGVRRQREDNKPKDVLTKDTESLFTWPVISGFMTVVGVGLVALSLSLSSLGTLPLCIGIATSLIGAIGFFAKPIYSTVIENECLCSRSLSPT